ncbi:NirA family protein [Rariglobus hedericola]|uniref:NirA family protein n=1 Tax=Rariglobus hedericola TaxID=2597822 RepID=A0A556QQ89_9BACT|nr:NirA family protein [Rariglobus hedericola]TSJ78815.1 NirA family protein [Rariglobus hedericola]
MTETSTTFPAGTPGSFTAAQKEYLQGFMAGAGVSFPFSVASELGQAPAPLAPEPTIYGTALADLCKEELWKHKEDPLDSWERLIAHADANRFPDAENMYRFKTHGLFYVAPAQDSFMIRLRVPACEITAHQFHGLADLASEIGNGHVDLTTRGNVQLRELKPRDLVTVLTRVQELGLTSRGAGADNIRNVTASPNCGFDPSEVLDVRPYAKAVHHYIMNHRDCYGLPRKFNIAFDNGGSLTVAADTNDIAFIATRISEKSVSQVSGLNPQVSLGTYFRVQLGGISGHQDFARDTGLLIKPSEATAVSAAIVRVFAENGDRTNRKKARLKYVLDKWGFDRFFAEVQKKLSFPLVRVPLTACEPRRPLIKHGWIGPYKQAQKGFTSIGIGVPVGRMSAKQMHGLATLAANFGKSELRLTIWQNVIIPHVPDALVASACRQLQHLGFTTEASSTTSGIIACTGSRGCKYAAADTKGAATKLAKHFTSSDLVVEQPVNIHFTGCSNSCAQHYCGDIGLIGAKQPDGADGFHMVLGGGMDHEQGIAREIFRGVRATEVPALTERILRTYNAKKSSGETFVQWTRRHSDKELQEFLSV